MSKNVFIIASLACVVVVTANAQSYKKTELGIKTTIDSVDIEVQFYNPSTVRILKSPEGKTFTKKSFSVIIAPRKTAFKVENEGDEVSVKSESMEVDLNLKDGEISYSTPGGERLLSEKDSGVAFTDFNDAGSEKHSPSVSHLSWIKMKPFMV